MDDATAVVTGATRGIGRAVAEEFAAAGAHVVCCSREADDVSAVVEAIETDGGTATGIRADVRDEYDVERLMGTAARIGGEIDVVVACAGVYHGTPGETPIDGEAYSAYDDHLRTNARGVFATLREAAPHLAPEARALVPTGSVARDGTPGIGTYAVSKAAAEAIVRGFAADLDQTVGCVDPGQVATGLSGEHGRDPADVAPMFRWAAVDAPAEELDGTVVGLREWKTATR
ncbi:SDR family NAD(P)-dependent oxidoreductase [Natronoarchaeum rubrum]|uniref:SDR family NAD(P)-dependent oxidoreductase n=1 Tax=Natronoarchaeum rubrum TaxID=755311 RepID=UPI00211111FE|nr:SDR family oxidoreductase [Natronoarchaeum rubrum]